MSAFPPGPPGPVNPANPAFNPIPGDDFLNIGLTDPLKQFLAKFFHYGTPQGPQKLKKSHFSEFQEFLETINIDM